MEFQIFRMKPVCIGTMTTYLKCKKLCHLQSQILEDILMTLWLIIYLRIVKNGMPKSDFCQMLLYKQEMQKQQLKRFLTS